ncbi:hypothetical protein [Pseudomonas chlororaphis]|nr:hypothetical protein [Pseudomonas chlororaphis]
MKARMAGFCPGALPGGSSKAVPGLVFDCPGAHLAAVSLEVL